MIKLQYSSNGLLFGSSLIRASSQFEITDSRLAGNVSEFMQQCVFYDILTGFYTWGDIVDSPDLWNMLQRSANPARSFQYQDTSGSKSIVTCPAGAALLNTDWSSEITRAQAIYGKRMFPGDPMAETKFIAALLVSYAYMGNITTTAADAIRQNMMSNTVKRSPPSPTNCRVLAFGQIRTAIIVTDDLGMHQLAKDFEIAVWHGHELLKKMLTAKAVNTDLVREIFEALETTAPHLAAQPPHRVFQNIWPTAQTLKGMVKPSLPFNPLALCDSPLDRAFPLTTPFPCGRFGLLGFLWGFRTLGRLMVTVPTCASPP